MTNTEYLYKMQSDTVNKPVCEVCEGEGNLLCVFSDGSATIGCEECARKTTTTNLTFYDISLNNRTDLQNKKEIPT